MLNYLKIVGVAVIATVAINGSADAAAVRAGFNGNTLAANDDGSTGSVGIGFTIDFFGVNYSSLYVNNNGNATFNNALSTYTPFGITGGSTPMLAPFFADVDTRTVGSPVSYGSGLVGGRDAFGINWVDVGHFSGTTSTNSFQLVLIDRSDTGAGNFDIEFNYDRILWETGNFSGGSGGLGGSSARVGYTNGAGTFFEFAGSGVNGAFLDSNLSTGLIHNSNVGLDGRYVFSARSGTVEEASVPAPGALVLLGFGLIGLGVRRRA